MPFRVRGRLYEPKGRTGDDGTSSSRMAAAAARVPLYIRHVLLSVQRGLKKESKLPPAILEMEGMSGVYTRHIYNNLCSLSNLSAASNNAVGNRLHYLEIGTWKGSSFLSAMYQNGATVHGTCIDNWSEFGGPKTECVANIARHLVHHEPYRILDTDCWSLSATDIGPDPVDLYLYDGPHTFEDHRRAITTMAPYLAPVSIVIVDDWCCDWAGVRSGTLAGFDAVQDQIQVRWKLEIPILGATTFHTRGDTTWNGMGIFVCQRA